MATFSGARVVAPSSHGVSSGAAAQQRRWPPRVEADRVAGPRAGCAARESTSNGSSLPSAAMTWRQVDRGSVPGVLASASSVST